MKKNGYDQIVLYKPGSLTAAGLRDLKAAGYTCVKVNGMFGDLQFRVSDGFGIEDINGDVQMMVVKAALESYSFGDKLGALMVKAIKKKVADAEAVQK